MASWLVSTWKGLVFVANFKEIMAMCLEGASYVTECLRVAVAGWSGSSLGATR